MIIQIIYFCNNNTQFIILEHLLFCVAEKNTLTEKESTNKSQEESLSVGWKIGGFHHKRNQPFPAREKIPFGNQELLKLVGSKQCLLLL